MNLTRVFGKAALGAALVIGGGFGLSYLAGATVTIPAHLPFLGAVIGAGHEVMNGPSRGTA